MQLAEREIEMLVCQAATDAGCHHSSRKMLRPCVIIHGQAVQFAAHLSC